MKRSTIHLRILIFAATLSGCTGMKNISSKDPLFVGSNVHFSGHNDAKRKLTPVIKDVVKPRPNDVFLWTRPALALNNMLSEKAKKKKFWKNKIKDPVLLSQTRPDQVSAAIQNRIFHRGYFQNTVAYDTLKVGAKKAKYNYTVTLHDPYRFESIDFPEQKNDLSQKILESKAESLLKEGAIYTLEDVKNERTRIDRHLKENGYIYFNPEFITLRADTVSGDHQIEAALTIKPETPPESRRPYSIRKVFIHTDYALERQTADTIGRGSYFLISQNNTINFEALQRGFFLKPGELYSHSNYLQTLRYMNELPIIRNANIKFSPVDSADQMDATLYLSQRKRFAYSAEFNTIFRSTNYFGPGIIFSYTDRNVDKAAGMLKLNLRGRFEMQIVEGHVNPAYEAGLEANYTLPRLYPEAFLSFGRKNLPKTNISLGYNLFNRLDLYRMNSVYANFGYRWRKNNLVSHSFNPIEVIFTKVPEASKSEEFNNYLAENPGVKRSFDEQFVAGLSYDFTYEPPRFGRNEFYFRGGIDMAGNLLRGIYSIAGAPQDSAGRYTLLGVPFSQFIRPRIDIRNNFNINQKSKLVSRFIAGVGIPLTNSDILPYIKQFYVGGTNSLRSFVARSVGPGSEVPPEGYNDLTGDIRLECNVEYRFNIAGSLKGALFVDAGNIWLYNKDPSRPNASFHFDTFMDQIAISSGWGLRWDFDFIVARVDFGYTLRTPYLPHGERWATNFDLWNPALNIAIGYPF